MLNGFNESVVVICACRLNASCPHPLKEWVNDGKVQGKVDSLDSVVKVSMENESELGIVVSTIEARESVLQVHSASGLVHSLL